MSGVPRLVIAAPGSGTGKTTVATGLMAALAGRGMRVSPHKVGPDYIDPGYHALATGRPGRNLDPWLTSEDLIAPLFLHGSAGADVAVIEGVMGLFDGVAPGPGAPAAGRHDHHASTAHVARLLDAPVVLVVDAAGQGQSVAALVHGFASYDTRIRLGGVILNRLASERHEEICRGALEDAGVPVFGAIRRAAEIETPSRHLGLIPVAERRAEAVRTAERLAALVAESCDLDGLVRLARSAPALPGPAWSAEEAVGRDGTPAPAQRPRIAVAGGAAFTFGYAEHVELLEAAGGEVVTFDPLHDEALPEGTGGLVLPGGFPEVYASALSANVPLRGQVAAFRGPISAECAGLLYLGRELDGLEMCGVLDTTAQMTRRLTLGYRDAVAVRDTLLTREGERFRGHEFHRTVCTPPGEPVFRWRDGADGHVRGAVLASYLHLHWAGSPRLAARLVDAARPSS
ncbi:hydrogenobyrinate a,c-diamide synthase [Planotetraspora thailandica]|uniref:Hydrogenobyrinate a,c-diamide synthase n=1 Tax=Planotetraspora thailandica TaxID=487172 RepID=A0A8J3XT48_9ACTN|nr:cobyrinate a,c-diamide synthase [Planotetraspora thailandica]GII51800.1 hydrogenobyrinate a,c-diamide synthase [Planotetraspora thailandica]